MRFAAFKRWTMTAVLLTVGAALVGARGAPAAALDSDAVLARFQAWLDATRSLDARFEQEMVSGALGIGDVERGRLRLLRPGRMRWDYEDPERKVAIVDGQQTLLYLAEDRQLFHGSLADGSDLLPLLLAGDQPLRDVFEAALQRAPGTGEGDAYVLALRPRISRAELERVVLTLEADDFSLVAARVHDASGNTMDVRLDIRRRNRSVDAEAFAFSAPPGTERIGAPDGP